MNIRTQVAPQDVELQLSETNLCVVTDPMKSVTKLGRASHSSAAPSLPMPAEPSAAVESVKRKYRETLEEHAQQLQSIADTQAHIMQELGSLLQLAQQQQLTQQSSLDGAARQS